MILSITEDHMAKCLNTILQLQNSSPVKSHFITFVDIKKKKEKIPTNVCRDVECKIR